MKINIPSGIPASGKKKSSLKVKKTTAATTVPRANDAIAEASQDAMLMKKAIELVERTPDVREKKVEALKKKIASGEYRPDSRKIAEALVEEHLAQELAKKKR